MDSIVRRIRFNGSDYDPALDNARLTKQIGRVYDCMIGGEWRTLEEIKSITHDPPASISAQLRHLKKPRFGKYQLKKRRRGNPTQGLFEYQLLPPVREESLFKEENTPVCVFNDTGQGCFIV